MTEAQRRRGRSDCDARHSSSDGPSETAAARRVTWRVAVLALTLFEIVTGAAIGVIDSPARADASWGGGVDTTHVVTSIPIPGAAPSSANGLATDEIRHLLYVADRSQGLVIDERSGVVRAFAGGLGGAVNSVAVDSAANRVFLAKDDEHGNSWVVDVEGGSLTVGASVPMGGTTTALATDSLRHRVFAVGSAGDTGAGRLQIVDVGAHGVDDTLVASIPVGRDPEAVAFDSGSDVLYVCNQGDDSVSVIDAATGTVIHTLALGHAPHGVAVDTVSHRAFVTSSPGSVVDVIGTTLSPTGGAPSYDLIGAIGVAGAPWGIAVDTSTHLVYVATEGSADAVIIDGVTDRVAESVGPVPGNHLQMSVDSVWHVAYMSSRNENTLAAVTETLALSPYDPPDARVGAPYSTRLQSTGRPAPTFAIAGGALPPGLSLDPSTGVLVGTPGAPGSYWFTITASNGVSLPASQAYNLRVERSCRPGWCS